MQIYMIVCVNKRIVTSMGEVKAIADYKYTKPESEVQTTAIIINRLGLMLPQCVMYGLGNIAAWTTWLSAARLSGSDIEFRSLTWVDSQDGDIVNF